MPRVLVIDDDRQMRAMIRQMLERDGYEVTEAPDGEQGLRVFVDAPADLVIVDLYMPRRGGWETIRALQERAPGLPFVIVSGGGALEGVAKGSAGTLADLQGVAAFRVLRKPFEWRALTAALNELLRGDGEIEEDNQ